MWFSRSTCKADYRNDLKTFKVALLQVSLKFVGVSMSGCASECMCGCASEGTAHNIRDSTVFHQPRMLMICNQVDQVFGSSLRFKSSFCSSYPCWRFQRSFLGLDWPGHFNNPKDTSMEEMRRDYSIMYTLCIIDCILHIITVGFSQVVFFFLLDVVFLSGWRPSHSMASAV